MQLDALYDLVIPHEECAKSALKTRDLIRYGDHVFQAALFGECFYMFAHRIWDVAEILNSQWRIGKFTKEPRGIIVVRNQLIVHPDKRPEASLIRSFMVHPEKGLLIKPTETGAPKDRGFRANADEFQKAILAWTTSVSEHFDSTT